MKRSAFQDKEIRVPRMMRSGSQDEEIRFSG
jgi:hypothetical protein